LKSVVHLRGACFFFSLAAKKRNKRKPPEKKASVFSGWCYYERQCYCAAGLINSGGLCYRVVLISILFSVLAYAAKIKMPRVTRDKRHGLNDSALIILFDCFPT